MSSSVQESDRESSASPEPGTTQNESNVTDSDSDTDKFISGDPNRPTFALKMLNFCKEVAIMVLIAAAYAALTNESPPKVSKSPAAYPFFSRDSLVTDWYKGQITQAIEEARSSDIAFVMFYAPWDAESQTARKQFELTARYMHKEVVFAAVNCWQPGSECKRQYSKVYKWPVLIAYPTHGRGIQYSGPLEAFHMISFLQNICKPIVRPEKVDDLMGKYDIIVVAHINVLPGSYEYAVFYSTALRFLERDPFRETVFAVIPQKYDRVPSISLHNWNRTIKYKGEWNPESLSGWILKYSNQVTGWVSPSGMKSLTLASFMQPGPTLILFTPKNPLLHEIDYYDMLREISYDYHNCANETYIATKQKLVAQERSKNIENHKKLKQMCNQLGAPKTIVTHLPNIWTNTSIKEICNCNKEYTGCALSDFDHLSPDNLQRTVTEEACRRFLLAQKYAPPIFERRGEGGVNVTGLACATNTSLTFVAVDSLRFYQFAERLGVDLRKAGHRSGVVVVNEKMETHHVMTTNLNAENVRSFIHNFTKKSLSRSLRSKVDVKTKSRHMYPYVICLKSNEFCLPELTSQTFLPTVLQENKVVIVFYYSKQCSFCNGIGYIFLTVAKMLVGVDDVIFSRIDGDSNLLPWEYTMESYPMILFFPAKRKSESRAFPKNLPITVPNLLGFILTNVKPVLKLKTMWSICNQTKLVEEKTKCMSSVRMETLSIIGKTLKEWRVSLKKQKVLYKLQKLRHLHLLFAHFPEETSKVADFLNKLRD